VRNIDKINDNKKGPAASARMACPCVCCAVCPYQGPSPRHLHRLHRLRTLLSSTHLGVGLGWGGVNMCVCACACVCVCVGCARVCGGGGRLLMCLFSFCVSTRMYSIKNRLRKREVGVIEGKTEKSRVRCK
jgi:hypothetical protein